MTRYPQAILTLIAYLKKLPGVGTRTAERFAFELLSWKDHELKEFGTFVTEVKNKIHACSTCGCLKEDETCYFCTSLRRETHSMCIISSPKDVYLFEETGTFRGLYHVLGALLSPLDGKTPEDLALSKIIDRIRIHQIKEVIIALDATVEGDTTALFLKDRFEMLGVHITRLALGLPMGSTLDYIDKSTLAQALIGRQTL